MARLLCHFDDEKMFKLEAGGYPAPQTGITPDIWAIAVRAGRKYETRELLTNEIKTYAYIESLAELEAQIDTSKLGLQVSQDASGSGPPPPPMAAYTTAFKWTQTGNSQERQTLRQQILTSTKRLAERRLLIYNYVSRVYHELKYSQIMQDVFSDYRRVVDSTIGLIVPDAIKKFAAVHENLRSSNPEDWSNSAHSCRRILQDLADALFPPQKESRFVNEEGNKREIKLGPDQYINRLVCYTQDRAQSKRYLEIVGSHLAYLGDRLDAIFNASQKGSHKEVSKEEANRVAIFTYMLVGDILALVEKKEGKLIS